MFQMIEAVFVTTLIIDSFENIKKFEKYISIASVLVAAYLWTIYQSEVSYVVYILCGVIIFKCFDEKSEVKETSSLLLPLSVLCLAPFYQSMIFSFIYLMFKLKKDKFKTVIFPIWGLLVLALGNNQNEERVLIPMIVFVTSLYAIRSFYKNHFIQMAIAVVLQYKMYQLYNPLDLYLYVKIIILIISLCYLYLIWTNKRKDRVWALTQKIYFLIVWFALLQVGPIGFWSAIVFQILLNSVLKDRSTLEKDSIVKIKTFALASLTMLPLSVPMYYLVGNMEIKSLVFGLIMSAILIVANWRWLGMLQSKIKEVIIDKWLLVDLLCIIILMIFLAYTQFANNYVGLFSYSAVSLVALLLFLLAGLGIKLDKMEFNPKINSYFEALPGSKDIELNDVKCLTQSNLVVDIGKYAHHVLGEFFSFVDRTFIVFMILICTLVLFMGGAFA